jgi:hypothetical protein
MHPPGHPEFTLRPTVSASRMWSGQPRKRAVPNGVRAHVLKRDDYTCASCRHRALKWMHVHHIHDHDNEELSNLALLCPACHAVLHFGRSMQVGALEVWKSTISQLEIVQKTREGIRKGKSLDEINSMYGLSRGRFAPSSLRWPNDLLLAMGDAEHAQLPEPLCVVFVRFSQWQVDA